MSSTYTTVTGLSVTFTATDESWAEAAGAEITVITFPGGDTIDVSIGGQRETTRTFKALLANLATFRQFRSMRAKKGSLFVENWDTAPVNAILQRVAPDAIKTDGQIVCQAQFLLY
jgi:hypothetical protein